MKVWVRYTVIGWCDSRAYHDDVEFRVGLLGSNHWSAMSISGARRYITLHVEEDIALMFAMKYQNCRIDKAIEST